MRPLASAVAIALAVAASAVPYNPIGYTVTFGTENGANNPSKLGAVDNFLVDVSSALNANTNLQTTQVVSVFAGPPNTQQGTPASVTVWMWAPVQSLANAPLQQIEIFDFSGGFYTVIDRRQATAFTNFVVVPIADIWPYITAQGTMRLRTTMTWPANSPFVLRMDYQEINI